MKVLFINDYAAPQGGSEVATATLKAELRRRGHDARIFAGSGHAAWSRPSADYYCFTTMSRGGSLLEAANPWAFFALRKVLARFQPDVVHARFATCQVSPLVLPLLARIPSVCHVVTYKPLCPMASKVLPDGSECQSEPGLACLRNGCLPLHGWIPQMIHRSLWRRWRGAFAATVANSGALKRQLEESGIAPVEVIWNGVPEVPTRPPLAGQPTIAFAGRLAREKGADVLVRAFAGVAAETPDARLIIVGDGPERGRLTRQIAALGLASRVTLTGHLSAGDMERVLRPAWVQAMPSRFETFGSVAAEAMMRGTAVVASRVGGLCEIVQDGRSGILVPPGDDAALAAALLGIIRNRDAAERMGREGRAFAMANLRVETAADRMLQLYSRLIAARGDKPCRVR